jgi:hypothetical protein
MAACVALLSGLLASCDDSSNPASITGTPARTATVGRAYNFRPNVIDTRKGLPVAFTIAHKPSWAAFDIATGELSGTPAATGVFAAIRISVEAGVTRASLPEFSITVVPASTAAAGSNTTAAGSNTTATGPNGVTISWQAPRDNTDGSVLTNLSGYKIYYGGASGEYSSSIDLPNPSLNSYLVQNLPAGQYYFTVTSYNSDGVESGFSPEVSATLD